MMWWQFFFCFSMSILLTSSKAPAQDFELSFPESFEHAVVSVYRMPQPDEYLTGIVRFSCGGEELSIAKGSVRIPPGSWVSVEVASEDGYEQFIESLPTSGINRIELRGAAITTKLLASIEKQQSLRQLLLVGCTCDVLDVKHLSGSKLLQAVSIDGDDRYEHWSCLMPWLAKCPTVQFIFSGFPMQATDLRAFSNHRSPLFLSVKLDVQTKEIVDALERIEGLVGLELSISSDVSDSDLERVFRLPNLEAIVLNDGVLDAQLVRKLASIDKLKVLRVQGSTKVEDFLEDGLPLKKLEAVSFTRPLETDLNRRFVDICLQLESLRELPYLNSLTASQLGLMATRTHYTRLNLDGLDSSASESMIADVVRQNARLKSLTISNLQLTPELGDAISGCSLLENLELNVAQFDGRALVPGKLSNLRRLRLSSEKPPVQLDTLQKLPNVRYMEAAFSTFDPKDCAVLAKVPSLESLVIESGFCDASVAAAVGKNPSIRRFLSRQNCLLDDASVDALLANDRLTDLDVGGAISEAAILKLGTLPNLNRLSVRTNMIEEDSESRLQQAFGHLQSFECRSLQLSLGTILKGKDGFERWVPDQGREQFDDLEGNSLKNLLGESRFADLRENMDSMCTLVEFWGTWCGPCMSYEPELQRLYSKYHHLGLRIVSVHSKQGHELGAEYLKDHPKPWVSLIDDSGELASSFKVGTFPSLFLFDARGKLLVALPHRLVVDRTIAGILISNNY